MLILNTDGEPDTRRAEAKAIPVLQMRRLRLRRQIICPGSHSWRVEELQLQSQASCA